jgi:hypothetical protein
MKHILYLLLGFLTLVSCQTKVIPSESEVQLVEASCGTCQFDLKGDDCALAVRIDGKAYFVDGTSIDDHGDAHAKDGFCQAVRKAEVKGKLVNDRFAVSQFKLVP